MSTDGLHLTEIWCKVDVSFSGFSKTKQNHVRYCDAMIFRNKYLKCKLSSESVRSSIWTITLKLYDIWFSGNYWRYESEFRVGRSRPDRVFTLELWILRLASFGGKAREEVHCWRLANDERLFIFRRHPPSPSSYKAFSDGASSATTFQTFMLAFSKRNTDKYFPHFLLVTGFLTFISYICIF